jgi:hypothetical protein
VGKRQGSRGSHKNKYSHLAPKEKAYNEEDKSRRFLRVVGKPGIVIPKGSVVPYHGRMYRTESDVTIPLHRRFGRRVHTYAWCRLERMLPGE